MVLDATDASTLESVGCFSIGTYDPWKVGDRIDAEMDACRRFVRPLMTTATHARLYPSSAFRHQPSAMPSFLIRRRGFLELDLSQECVVGHEEFWRAGASGGEYLRGTVVVVSSGRFRSEMLKGCVLYGIPSSRYQLLKGISAAALGFARESSRGGNRCFVFSASNGVEHVDVFSPVTELVQEYLAALGAANKPGWRIPDA